MFEYIKGTLVEYFLNQAVIDVNGIGYKLLIPLSTYTHMPQVGSEALFYVSAVIREDSHRYFGFLSRKERDFFEKLSDVSGIGPKTALSLIGHMDSSALEEAISSANIFLLSKVPGIGKKTAERLIVELKDKIKTGFKGDLPSVNGTEVKEEDNTVSDALNALMNLGYNTMQAQKAIKKALEHTGETPELSKLITTALKGI